ncbi:MAG: zinc-finger domain-containing protein [Hydrogenophilaceae bacterium]|nr:zinc-finger domain-containing protein [Hydrogenophilaceae bacterium]
MSEQSDNTQRIIEIKPNQLPLHCPLSEHVSWNSHPRVFLPIEKTGEALCPYCGTQYRLQGGPCSSSH